MAALGNQQQTSELNAGISSKTINGRPVLAVKDVQELEQRIAAEGTSLKELMARAGKSIADYIQEKLPEPGAAVIFTGSGNNGGDGWVVANLLSKAQWQVILVCPKPAEELSAEPARETALEALAAWDAAGSDINPPLVLVNPSSEDLSQYLSSADVVVDGILGTGFSGSSIRAPYSTWIELANAERAQHKSQLADKEQREAQYEPQNKLQSEKQSEPQTAHKLLSIAADIPSGLSANTGQVASPCFEADATITMIVYKPALTLEEAKRYTGEVILSPLVENLPE